MGIRLNGAEYNNTQRFLIFDGPEHTLPFERTVATVIARRRKSGGVVLLRHERRHDITQKDWAIVRSESYKVCNNQTTTHDFPFLSPTIDGF